PLTVIRGFIQTLRRKDIDLKEKDRDEYFAVIERQSDRLYSIVEDLLYISRLEGGVIDMNHGPVDLKRCISRVHADRFDSDPRISVEGDAQVITDYERMSRLIGNLIDNALRFSPADSPVKIDIKGKTGTVEIVVADKGSGIPPAELERIFERFHQVGGSLRREHSGFGLGLYMVQRLLDDLGGTITVESEVSQGSTFKVVVPRRSPTASGGPTTSLDSLQDARGTRDR
ncbi:MAG: HAMP domain-containing histidine kinase, partial [Actinobacteria bacterium]|nr:HAMP domain-containing histidine kinase [Actinomycetota bacterium]